MGCDIHELRDISKLGRGQTDVRVLIAFDN